MVGVFLNFSNHPSTGWSVEQREAAEKYGRIQDLPFPVVSADASEEDIQELADVYLKKIREYSPSAVMCQGEFTLSFAIVKELLKAGIMCVSACSERVVQERIAADGRAVKKSVFRFVKFREYRMGENRNNHE